MCVVVHFRTVVNVNPTNHNLDAFVTGRSRVVVILSEILLKQERKCDSKSILSLASTNRICCFIPAQPLQLFQVYSGYYEYGFSVCEATFSLTLKCHVIQ